MNSSTGKNRPFIKFKKSFPQVIVDYKLSRFPPAKAEGHHQHCPAHKLF
ncbi:MAG: hypothetical protein K2W95_16465 [Candidatus Obscuribacterales bacterium]|nr:hypothetical protein [Candidatus Obscuribacterales bacterium]